MAATDPPSPSLGNSVYIKGIPFECPENSISDALSPHGEIDSITRPEGRDFCFVTFTTEEGAKSACDAGNATIGGSVASVAMRKGNRQSRLETSAELLSSSIYIPSVPDETTEEDIQSLFSGEKLVSVRIRNASNGRQYVFVEFDEPETMKEVLNGGPYTIRGETITVEARRPYGARWRGDGAFRPVPGKGGTSNDGKGRMKNPPKAGNSIYITGFPVEVKEEDITSIFQQYGNTVSTIVRVKYVKDGEEEMARTWSFVEYDNADAVKKAVEAANTETGGSGIELGGIYVTVEARKSEPTLFYGRRGGRGRRGRQYWGNRRSDHQNDLVQDNKIEVNDGAA